MLVIREAQIQTLIAANDDRLAELIEEAVRRVDSVRVDGIAPRRLSSMVQRCMEQARGMGLNEAENIAAFTALMFSVSPQFYRQHAIAAVLDDKAQPVPERLFQLFERVKESNWDEAVRLYDEGFWFDDPKEDNESSPAKPVDDAPVDYIELTIKQADSVDAAVEKAKASPGEKAMKQVEIEVEKLCFYQTAARGKPKVRAQHAAELARAIVLEKAITKQPPEPK